MMSDREVSDFVQVDMDRGDLVPSGGSVSQAESMTRYEPQGATSEDIPSTSDTGVRSRRLTDRGLSWQIEGLSTEFKSKVSRWRKSACSAEILLSDSTDTAEIRRNRQELVSIISELDSIVDHVIQLLGSQDFPQEYKQRLDEFHRRLEAVQNDHHSLLKDIKVCLRNLEGDSQSVSGKSRTSHISHSSRPTSCTITDTKAEAAALRAKLKYMDIEARHKADLERNKADLEKVETMRQLDMAQAKLDVMEDATSTEPLLLDNVDSVPQMDPMERTESFVRYQTGLQGQRKSETVPDLPPVTSIEATIPVTCVSQSISSTSVTTGTRQSPTNTLANLNPSVADFVPSHSWIPASGYTSIGAHGNAKIGSKVEPRVPITQTTRSVAGPLPTILGQDNTNTQQGLVELARSLADQVNLGRLPAPEPSIFMGDPLKYPSWKVSFKTLIEQRRIPPAERIHYLQKYIGGKVRDVVENFFLLSTDTAYEDAKQLLEERFGNPFVIANAFRDKLEKWPKVNARDSFGLQRFADFLKQCYTAMQSIGYLNVLNDDRENRKMLAKLPDWLIARWARIVSSRMEERKEFPPFKDFMDFMVKEAKIATDPVTSLQAVKSDQSGSSGEKSFHSKGNSARPGVYSKSLLTVDESERASAFTTHGKGIDKCILCQGFHELDACRQYLAKELKERKQFARDKRLCFGCLREGHVSRKCKRKLKCNICSKFHPTSLHGDIRKTQNSGSSHGNNASDAISSTSGATLMIQAGTSKKCSMILPVYVSHEENPSVERLVYALLDTQSDTTFILKSTCESLGIAELPVKLRLSTMHAENKVVNSSKVQGLIVRGYDSQILIKLPDTYTRSIMPANRSHIPTPDVARQWPHLEHLADQLLQLQDCEVGLLIGYNCTKALMPRDIVAPVSDGPFGQRTDLGWGIVGTDDSSKVPLDDIGVSHHIVIHDVPTELRTHTCDNLGTDRVMFSLSCIVKEVINPRDLTRMLEMDFNEYCGRNKTLSQEDRQFITIIENGIHQSNGHYEMPLPFKENMPVAPNNQKMAIQRLQHLRKRLLKDKTHHSRYTEFMRDLIDKGFDERVPPEEIDLQDGHEWYIPHHGVYHPQKPGKLRVVFDCSAKYMDWSLNELLLQGPDQNNLLCGVLCRFRKEPVAFVCDVEKMFLQFKVNPEHRNYLRFLWWENGDLSREPTTYRMTVHLFGATSSPSCAIYALKKAATDLETEFGSDVANFIRRDFYVDDGLKSVSTAEECVSLIERSVALFRSCGLFLHKIVSNSKEVLKKIPGECKAKEVANIDIHHDNLPVERTLGIQWCVESDSFQFRITLSDRPLTRRGVLSTLSSVYDPLGFVAPFILLGKQILQEMCKDQTDWDSPLPETLRPKWRRWIDDVKHLASLNISRCLKPPDFGNVVTTEVHHFSDASTVGYGQCSYLRLIDEQQRTHCTLLMSKSRVVPIKPVTIPRLELTAALVSVRVSSLLLEELDITNVIEWFWTDSNVVLGYIANESRRFHVFVANRISQIRDHTEPYQWNYISSSRNPADIASRGATPDELRQKTMWFKGPDFLKESNLPFTPQENLKFDIRDCDPEVKQAQVFGVKTEPVERASILDRLKYFSSWTRAKTAIALCLKLRDKLLRPVHALPESKQVNKPISLSVENLQEAETEIVKQVQREFFSEEIKILSLNAGSTGRKKVPVQLKHASSIYRLDPFLDEYGVLRVGGRVGKADFNKELKHPIILPKKSHVTELVISHFHQKTQHQGRSMTTNEIRQNGFWILGCSSVVYSFVSKCVICRKHRSSTQEQKMSVLPVDRLKTEPPFTYSGVDFFGPFYIKEGRKELKRWGVLFTCMSSRAIHLETANSLDTSSFINALRRFISVRGVIRQLRSDRGTNFIGAKRELREAVEEMDDDHLKLYLSKEGCDYLVFKTNVPSASHMGGVWERQIRTVRNVLSSVMDNFGSQLDDETLRTFFSETMAIVNSRPLTVTSLHDPLAAEPLTPNHLLTMKSKIVLPPPGKFQRPDVYCRKRWRRVQYLADEFWTRWKREFLQTLQERSKWSAPRRNLSIGDVVLIKDDNLPRNVWHLGRVIETSVGNDGLVRTVKLAVGDRELDQRGRRIHPYSMLERPIHKLILVQEAETGEDPIGEP